MRQYDASPGLTAGGGLKLEALAMARRIAFPRPHRRGRIETATTPPPRQSMAFPPASPPGAD